MCSFLFTTWFIQNLAAVNFFLQRRGPDHTNVQERNGFTFVHNLLHMTGDRVIQPFIDDENDIVAMFNGEIYNYLQVPSGYEGRHRYKSDGECLLPSYKQIGSRFPCMLDGEWALAVVDFKRNIAILSTDVFSTKPLWYSLHDGLHAASYASALLELGLPQESVRMMDPNQVLVFDLTSNPVEIVERHAVHEFDLRQHKSTTEDWQLAFRRAVKKRTLGSNHPVFVGLSSGYDSGALHLALEVEAAEHSVNYFTVAAEELPQMLKTRIRNWTTSVARAWNVDLSLFDFQMEKDWLYKYSEHFFYGEDNWSGARVQEDVAAVGLSAIFRRCRKVGILVMLSGAGADEVISDYGFRGEKFFPHSSFGGLFPSDLESIFPWHSVFLGTQRDYLMKEEIVAGSHGIEARYPFLDRAVVQEFLWLTDTAKNELYKRPVHDFLESAGYPFDVGNKRGFAAGRNLKLVGATNFVTTVDPIIDLFPSEEDSEFSDDELCSGLEWTSWRSRLATLAVLPLDDPDYQQELMQHWISFMSGEQEMLAIPCPFGHLALHLFTMLVAKPGARTQMSIADYDTWEMLWATPWQEIIQSGWPIFELLRRLSMKDRGDEGNSEVAATQQPVGRSLPPGMERVLPVTCEKNMDLDLQFDESERSLDIPLAMLATSKDTSTVKTTQTSIFAVWNPPDKNLRSVLGSARLCGIFTALSKLSAPYLRANWGDAWMLLTSKYYSSSSVNEDDYPPG